MFCICRSDGCCFVFPLYPHNCNFSGDSSRKCAYLNERERTPRRPVTTEVHYLHLWLARSPHLFICHMEEQCALSKHFHFHPRQVITVCVHFPSRRLRAAVPSLILQVQLNICLVSLINMIQPQNALEGCGECVCIFLTYSFMSVLTLV